MDGLFSNINWIGVFVSLVAGQVFLTLWFAVVFGEAWAKCYNKNFTKAEHTKEIPSYTYAIGAVCTFLLAITLSALQSGLQISEFSDALLLAALISVGIFVTTVLPGYAFLKKLDAFIIVAGSQVGLVFIQSIVLFVI